MTKNLISTLEDGQTNFGKFKKQALQYKWSDLKKTQMRRCVFPQTGHSTSEEL